jgi:hypothetical protein
MNKGRQETLTFRSEILSDIPIIECFIIRVIIRTRCCNKYQAPSESLRNGSNGHYKIHG